MVFWQLEFMIGSSSQSAPPAEPVNLFRSKVQGEGANHDQIRQQQLALGVTGRIAAALETWGAKHEEILWSILFSLAVLVKDGNEPFQPAIRSVAAAGIPSMLEQALESYKVSRCARFQITSFSAAPDLDPVT